MAGETRAPWPAIAGLGMLAVGLLATSICGERRCRQVWAGGLVVSSIGTGLSIGVFVWTGCATFLWDEYYAILAWLAAGAVALRIPSRRDEDGKIWWKALTMAWAIFGSVIWLGAAYAANASLSFYVGLGLNLALLLLCKRLFRLPFAAVQGVNTLILLTTLLPLVDLTLRPRQAGPPPASDEAGRGYLYSHAKNDPHALTRWHAGYNAQWERMEKVIFAPSTDPALPVLVRPNTQARFFQSEVHINSRGFRGPEIAVPKGNVYRIVVLGESTTFGTTLHPGHKPWPEILQQMIREQVRPGRPVEVINAGVPGYHLGSQLHRFAKDILPLEPDMIITYHGYNGFPRIDKALPPVFGKPPPVYRWRPLKLLADCEYRFKMIGFKRRMARHRAPERPTTVAAELMQTPFALDYQELVRTAQTNHTRLVAANFSMAVNETSDADVIDFYRDGFPAVYWQIKANAMHSLIVENIVRQHPELTLVDTHPNLDGAHDKFVDLIHFAPEGDWQLASNICQAIKGILLEEAKGSGPLR